MDTTLCAIHKKISFSAPYMLFLMRDFFLNALTPMHKLYDELLGKTSSEIELLTSDPSGKNRSALVPILHKSIPSIENNPPTFLSYKSISLPSTLRSKKPIVEIEEINNIDFDVEMQLPSPQQSLQSGLQILQEGSELKRSKY